MNDAAVSYNAKTGKWRLLEPLIVDAGGKQVSVPSGFQTDLASIPRIAWPIVAPFELSLAAPIVHDKCYETGQIMVRATAADAWVPTRVTRAQADRLLYDVAAAEGVWWWRRWLAYHAVRLFGAEFWKGEK